jgi:hypothetical protein
MKRFLASLAIVSLVEAIGWRSAIAGTLMLLGIGGGPGAAGSPSLQFNAPANSQYLL